MAEQFAVPAVDKLCAALRELIEHEGGAGAIFGGIERDAAQVMGEFTSKGRWLGALLHRLLDDPPYREIFVSLVSSESDRDLLRGFLSAWDVWKETQPGDAQFALLFLRGPLRQELRLAVGEYSNDIASCAAGLYLDSFTEDLNIKAVCKLAFPNKELGGPDGLVMVTKLSSFVQSIAIMLQSVLLTDSEKELLGVHEKEKIREPILKSLANAAEIITSVQKQFGGG